MKLQPDAGTRGAGGPYVPGGLSSALLRRVTLGSRSIKG